MSIQSEIKRIENTKENLRNILISAGYDIPSSYTIDQYPDIFQEIMNTRLIYQYKATFLFDEWTSIGTNYTQTVSVVPIDGAPNVTDSFSMMSTVSISDEFPEDTYETLRESSAIIDVGTKTFGSGTITCVTKNGQKPTTDVEVYFLAKKVI